MDLVYALTETRTTEGLFYRVEGPAFATSTTSTASTITLASSDRNIWLPTGSSNIITSSTAGWITVSDSGSVTWARFDKSRILKEAIRHRMSPRIGKAMAAEICRSVPEGKAQLLLREILTEDEFFRYIRRGWVSRMAASGKVYHIPLQGRIKIYDGGKHVENLCIHVVNDVPPSDRMFTLVTLLDFDEEAFRASGNLSTPMVSSLSVGSPGLVDSHRGTLLDVLRNTGVVVAA